MPTWRDSMTPASFRDAEFRVSGSEHTGGRRTVKHSYPLRDVPFVEDMGLRPRTFTIEGFVFGDDYFTAKNKLIAALETSGPGELLHPYFGRIRVACSTFRVRETYDDGGVARFSIEFDATTAEPPQPTAVTDPVAKVKLSAADAAARVREAFLDTYDVESQPAFALESLTAAISAAGSKMGSALAPAVSGTQELAALTQRAAALVSEAATLMRSPVDLADGMAEIMASLTSSTLVARRGVEALLEAYSFSAGARPPATTPVRIQERANFDAVTAFVRRLVIIQAAQIAVDQTYDSHNDALDTSEAIAESLEEQMEAVDDEAYPSLWQLTTDLRRALPGVNSTLPRLMSYTPIITEPSLALAYRLYGSVAMEADLVARNAIRHPGFVRGGRALEVLSRG